MKLITMNYIEIIHYGVVDGVTESCHHLFFVLKCKDAKAQRK